MAKGNGTRVSIAVLATKQDAMFEFMKNEFKEIKENQMKIEKTHADDNKEMDGRVRKLEDFKIKLIGIVTGVSAVITAIGQWISANIPWNR